MSRQIHQGWAKSFLPDSTCEENPVVLSLPIPENLQAWARAHRYCSGRSCHHCKDAACSATLACTVCSVPGRFPPCFGLTFVFHTSVRGTQTSPSAQPSPLNLFVSPNHTPFNTRVLPHLNSQQNPAGHANTQSHFAPTK